MLFRSAFHPGATKGTRYAARLCQNADTAFFLCAKPRLSQARALLLPKVFVSLGIKFFVMAKLHFRPYIPNQTVLFPQRIDENIAATDPVRIVNAVIDNLNLESFKKLYKIGRAHV